jgi:MFS transporter, DHA1 family, multidrug resistance protein
VQNTISIAEKRTALTGYLMLISLFGMMAVDIFLPALPTMAQALHVSDAAIQAIFPAYFAGVACAQLFCGPLSDHYGRKPILLVALALGVLGSLICGMTDTYHAVVLGRFVQGLGAGVAIVLWRAIAFDVLDKDAAYRMIATITPVIVISPAIMPIIGGGILAYLGWRNIFIAIGVVSACAFLVTAAVLPETCRPTPEIGVVSRILRSYKTFFGSPFFLFSAWTLSTVYAAYFLYIAQSPLVFDRMGYTPTLISVLYVPVAASFALGSTAGKKLRTRFSTERLLGLGLSMFVIGAAGVVIFCRVPGLHLTPIFLGAFCVLVMGNGVTLTVGVARLIAGFPGREGASSATLGLIQSLATILMTSGMALGNTHLSLSDSLATLFGVCIMSVLLVFVPFMNRPAA